MSIHNLIVRDLSHKGLGVIDHPDGRTFFVRGVWPGDEIEVEITSALNNYAEVKYKSIKSYSSNRTELICPHRGTNPGDCGGCPWMLANYSSQLEFKVKRLKHALEKRKVIFSELYPIIPSPQITSYRNRVQLKTNGHKIGYVSEGTSQLAPIENCLIMNEGVKSLFDEIKQSLPREDFKPAEGFSWNFIDLDDEMEIKDIKLNRRRPFRQGNTLQNEKMKSWLSEKLSSYPTHYPIIDLFCGSGNFTEIISSSGFQNILAVEVQGSALEILIKKKLQNVRILNLDILQKGSWAQIARAQPHAKILVVDPPREGIPKRRSMLKYLDNIETIIYISCELDTFARDASDFTKLGWTLQSLTPLDLFPHTPHVEIMAVFIKK